MKHLNRRMLLQVVVRRSMARATSVSSLGMLRIRSHIQSAVVPPVVSSSVSSSLLFTLKQQKRWMSDEAKNDESGDTDTVKVIYCYSKYEVMPGTVHDQADITTVKFDRQAILEQAIDVFGGDDLDLEYYKDLQWKPLTTDMEDLESFKASNTPIPIRVPFLYDESDYNEDKKDGIGDVSHPKDEMQETVERLVGELKEAGYARVSNDALNDPDTNATVSTRDWVLKQAASDTALRNLLLTHVFALEHIVECLHFDLLWVDNDDKEEGATTATAETIQETPASTDEAIKELA
jgi:hypothetical protein